MNALQVACSAVLLLAAAGCASPTPLPGVRALVERVSADRLRADVEALTALGPRPPRDAAATEATLAWLETRFREMGYEPRRETFLAPLSPMTRRVEDGEITLVMGPREEVEQANLVAGIRGTTDPGAVVEIGAHYDTVFGSPGADDNASGVAAVLEAARVLKDARPPCTLRFVLFAAEEYGFHGSRHHVERIRASGERPLGLFNMEMVGYASSEPGSQRDPVPWWIPYAFPDRADFVLVLGNPASGGLGNIYEDAVAAYAPGLGVESANRMGSLSSDGWRSDHASYWRRGLEAVQITDTGEWRTPHYHRPTDTADRLDYAFLRRVTMAAVAALLRRAEEECRRE